MSNEQFHAKNHYVSRFYLKRWASSDQNLSVYRTLVSRETVPLWARRTVKRIASQEHLYTRLAAGKEFDEFERWLDQEFESPAEPAIEKAVSGARLSPKDWLLMIRFLAAQDVRTPARLVEYLERAATRPQKELEETLKLAAEVLGDIEAQAEFFKRFPANEAFPLRVSRKPGPAPGTTEVTARIVLGRSSWLYSLRHLLTKTAKVLHEHRWTILRGPVDLPWFTSDDPVLRLNYHNAQNYNLTGGWNSRGTEIFMPLGPHHLMYAKIGERRPPMRGEVMPEGQAVMVRRFMAERAHRFIFATEPFDDVPVLRPRTVNASMFRDEAKQWRDWHAEQSAAERRLEN